MPGSRTLSFNSMNNIQFVKLGYLFSINYRETTVLRPRSENSQSFTTGYGKNA